MKANHMLSSFFSLTFAASAIAQVPCTGPQTGLPHCGQVVFPPAVSAPINDTYTVSFTVLQTGVYSLEGTVSLGRGGPTVFNWVHAEIDGVTVVDEAPPPIASSPPNGWTYVSSIGYFSIHKQYTVRRLLQQGVTYSMTITAQGYNPVYTPYHQRNYGIEMAHNKAILCGPPASVISVGQGCVGSNSPTLSSPAMPVLGTQRDVMISGTPSAAAWAVFGFETLTPTYLGAGCFVQMDLDQALTPIPAFTGAAGVGFAIYQIPPDPSLSGVRYAVQGILLEATSPVGFHLTNGLILTFGY